MDTPDPDTQPPEDAEAPAEGAPEGTLGRRGSLVDEASPAGAVWPSAENGGIAVQHGEPSPGLGVTPADDGDDSAEHNERQVLGVTEPEQVATTRPDIGTPIEEDE